MNNDFEEVVCRYKGACPPYNSMCADCPLYLNTCIPIASKDGYAMGSECDCFLCEGCIERCEIGDLSELWG